MQQSGQPRPPHPGSTGARRRVLLVDRPGRLDSLTARRRVAAHLAELELVYAAEGGPVARGLGGLSADAALVCDDPVAAGELSGAGLPVVHVHSGHAATLPPVTAAGRYAHRPGWLPGPVPASEVPVRPAGVIAPARLGRDRARSGCLLLLSAWEAAEDELRAYVTEVARPLAREAARRTGSCTVVCDAGHERVREVLAPYAEVRVHRAADVDVDALHAAAGAFLASPTLTAVSLAQTRRAPLAFLPPLGPHQDDLARRVRRATPIPTADPAEGIAEDPAGPAPWAGVDPAADDLRGAQRIARAVRQLVLAPTGF
ncbi:CGA synthase-related protein [Streptomyces pathocidini]|uniref:CGA synthase-related protein n=1 Tax=Streptomyces pathocidini TaxID=1650571 RepID=UPI0033C44598